MSMFQRYDYLPATRLCSKPFVFACFFEDFVKRIAGFKMWYDANKPEHKNIYGLMMLGYHYETPARMEWAKEQIQKISADFPTLKLRFLCNSTIEKNNFGAIGAVAQYCNQNAFLRENRYRVTPQKKVFEAVYLARFTPIKRHTLALKIPMLLLIGDYFERESKYAEGVLGLRRSDTTWIRKVRGMFMFLYLNRAKVGLCLSPEEGAMYACAEYGLCGLPVVTTRCLGGRENSLSPKYTHFIQLDNPEQDDVAAAVAEVAAKNFDPHEIRRATIAVFEEHRARYKALIEQIFAESKEGGAADMRKCLNFPHKFGVRCRVLPLFKYFRALRLRKK